MLFSCLGQDTVELWASISLSTPVGEVRVRGPHTVTWAELLRDSPADHPAHGPWWGEICPQKNALNLQPQDSQMCPTEWRGISCVGPQVSDCISLVEEKGQRMGDLKESERF